MAPRYALAKRRADELLREAGIRRAPVPVEKLVRFVDAKVVFRSFSGHSGQISGIVHRNANGTAVIGINSKERHERQRFTIAHELGHLLLHVNEDLHIDRNFPIGLRSGASRSGTEENEIEANQFAAALLMPPHFLAKDIAPLVGTDVIVAIEKLAAKYEVSEQAMSVRLSTLGYVSLGS